MMKHTSIASLVAMFLLSISAFAVAQNTLDFNKPVAVRDLVQYIAQRDGYTITNDELQQIPPAATYQGKQTDMSGREAYEALLQPSGLEAVPDGWTMHIRKAVGPNTRPQDNRRELQQQEYPGPETRNSTPTAPVDARRTRTEEMLNRFPQAFNRDGTIGSFEQFNQLTAETYQAATPTSSSFFGYGSGYNSSWFYDPAGRFFEDEKNRRSYGLLKIDGPDKFLQDVRVIVDGYDVSVGSKANNKWNSPVVLTAGPHTIEFVMERAGNLSAFRRQVMIQPMALMGRDPTWLRVTGNEFTNAREIYQYRQHRYVEDPDGSIRPSR